MSKDFTYKGKTLEELKDMTIKEFGKLVPARERRSLTRGLNAAEKKLLTDIRATNAGKSKATVKTHVRDMIILPEMVGMKIMIHNGQKFEAVTIDPAMLGHRLGEFSQTRGKVRHSSPGIGATRSSKFVPLK